jgi:hypothetical protein
MPKPGAVDAPGLDLVNDATPGEDTPEALAAAADVEQLGALPIDFDAPTSPADLGDDDERAAIAGERPAAVDEGLAAVRELRRTLVTPGAVADLRRLDAARASHALTLDGEQRRDDRKELKRLEGELARESDPKKWAQLITAARITAARLGPPALAPDKLGALEILRTEHTIPWLCEPLQLAPGRAPLFVGYNGDGKSTAMMALGVAFAAGWHAWGCERIRCSRTFIDTDGTVRPARLRVSYVDLDAGAKATAARIAEVMRAEGFDEELLEGAVFDVIDGKRRGLRLLCTGSRGDFPTPGDQAAYFAAWRALLAEYDLVIVDNLRRLGPSLNYDADPRAAVVLDLLGEASEVTGSVPLVLAHSPKGQNRGPHQAIKGKADLEGASGANINIRRDEDQRRHLELTRGVALRWAPLVGYLDLTEHGATLFTPDAEAGKVTGTSGKGAKTTPEARDAARSAAKEDAARKLIPDVVKVIFRSGRRGASKNDVCDKVTGNDKAIRRACEMAAAEGYVVPGATGAHARFYGPSHAPSETPSEP